MVWVRWAARLFAMVVFVANLSIHVATLAGNMVEWRDVQFFSCFVAVGVSGWVFSPALRTIHSLPLLLLLLIGLGIVYTTGYGCVTHAASGTLFNGGVIGGGEGDRYLHSHGKRIRDISEQEYQQYKLNDARQWSAAGAVFSFFAVVFSVIPPRRVTQPDPSSPPPADTPSAPPPEPGPPGG